MSDLLAVADVREGVGQWTRDEVESLQCALSSVIAPLCLPAPASTLGGSAAGTPSGNKMAVFAVEARLKEPVRCRTSDPFQTVLDTARAEVSKAAAKVLWFGGTGETDTWFGSPGVTSVGGTPTVGEVLKRWYEVTTSDSPIIHMGMKTASDLAASFNNEGRLAPWPDIPVVISSSYPADALAVSGPITIYVSQAEAVQAHDVRLNDQITEAAVLVGVAFDPCQVVLKGLLPDQVYVALDPATSARSITVYVNGISATATVSWGDATADSNIAAPGGNASHTYAAAGTYTVTVTSEGGTTTNTVTVA